MTLGQRIQELRKQQGLSQESLGEALGVSRQAVSKWEGDNGIPELDTLIAMSRLFGITIGALLGIEEAQPQSETVAMDEARLDAILKQYAEQVKPVTVPAKTLRWEWLAAALLAVAVVVIVLFGQVRALRSTVRNLQSQMSSLEVQVSNNLNNLSGQIRNSIYDVLEEQDQLLNTFSWEAVDVDLENETAVVRFSATMKEYQPDSRMQILLDWKKTDQTTGKLESDWVPGPDFSVEMTVPLNYHTEVSLRVQDAAGGIREQSAAMISDFDPRRFQLDAYNLRQIFALTINAGGATSTTTQGEHPHIDIYTLYPQLVRPEKAFITAKVNGEEVFSEEMTISALIDEKYAFEASIREGYFDLSLGKDDTLEIQLDVTDNFGNTQIFLDGGKVVSEWGRAPRLERIPMATPGIVVG